jgi:hypothetical protein
MAGFDGVGCLVFSGGGQLYRVRRRGAIAILSRPRDAVTARSPDMPDAAKIG